MNKQDVKLYISNLPINKNLFVFNIALIILALIYSLTATATVNFFSITYDFQYKLSDVKTIYILKPVSIMIAEIVGIESEYVMCFINIFLYGFAIFTILMPVFQKKPLKPKHFLMAKIATIISILEFLLFRFTLFASENDSHSYLKLKLDISCWLMIIVTLCAIVTSFNISHNLKKKKIYRINN